MTVQKADIKMASSEIPITRDFLAVAKTGDVLSAALLEFAAQFRPPQPNNSLKSFATNISFTSTHLKQLHETLQLPVQLKIDDELWTEVREVVKVDFEKVDDTLKKAIQVHREGRENILEASKLEVLKKLCVSVQRKTVTLMLTIMYRTGAYESRKVGDIFLQIEKMEENVFVIALPTKSNDKRLN